MICIAYINYIFVHSTCDSYRRVRAKKSPKCVNDVNATLILCVSGRGFYICNTRAVVGAKKGKQDVNVLSTCNGEMSAVW